MTLRELRIAAAKDGARMGFSREGSPNHCPYPRGHPLVRYWMTGYVEARFALIMSELQLI